MGEDKAFLERLLIASTLWPKQKVWYYYNNVFYVYRIAQLVNKSSLHCGPEHVFTDSNNIHEEIE